MLISNISKLTNAGVLAERTNRSPQLGFKRYNLLYGFNGSGKSTLSRCFASFQSGARVDRLPSGCDFEFQTAHEEVVRAQPGNLLAERLAVFNGDFVEENLQWSAGRANPVFYIGREQAELAAELDELTKRALPAAIRQKQETESLLRAKEQTLATFKRERARSVSQAIRPQNRKYEAPQLTSDYENLDLGEGAILEGEVLEAQREACKLDAPMPRLAEIDTPASALRETLKAAMELASQTLSVMVLTELERHPDMLISASDRHEIQAARRGCGREVYGHARGPGSRAEIHGEAVVKAGDANPRCYRLDSRNGRGPAGNRGQGDA